MRFALLLGGAALCLGARTTLSQTVGAGRGGERPVRTFSAEGHKWAVQSVESPDVKRPVVEREGPASAAKEQVATAGNGHTPKVTLLFTDAADRQAVIAWARQHVDSKGKKLFDAEITEVSAAGAGSALTMNEAYVARMTEEGEGHIRLELECRYLRWKKL